MMIPVIPSTFVLTLLLAVGLFFFVRASVKDRTEQEQLIAALNQAENQITFEGLVRPSWFLAIFLTLLTAVGLLCLGLVLSMTVANQGELFWGLVLLSPSSGLFYWQRAKRPEQVSLKLEAVLNPGQEPHSLITVRAHRDELATFKQALRLKPCE